MQVAFKELLNKIQAFYPKSTCPPSPCLEGRFAAGSVGQLGLAGPLPLIRLLLCACEEAVAEGRMRPGAACFSIERVGCTLGWDPAPPTAILCLDVSWLVGAVIQGPRQQSWGGPPSCIAHDQQLMPTQRKPASSSSRGAPWLLHLLRA